jgi:hypothetical protein
MVEEICLRSKAKLHAVRYFQIAVHVMGSSDVGRAFVIFSKFIGFRGMASFSPILNLRPSCSGVVYYASVRY